MVLEWRYPERYQNEETTKLVRDRFTRGSTYLLQGSPHAEPLLVQSTSAEGLAMRGRGRLERRGVDRVTLLMLVVDKHTNPDDEVLCALHHRLLHGVGVRNWRIVHANAIDRGVKEVEALLVYS